MDFRSREHSRSIKNVIHFLVPYLLELAKTTTTPAQSYSWLMSNNALKVLNNIIIYSDEPELKRKLYHQVAPLVATTIRKFLKKQFNDDVDNDQQQQQQQQIIIDEKYNDNKFDIKYQKRRMINKLNQFYQQQDDECNAIYCWISVIAILCFLVFLWFWA